MSVSRPLPNLGQVLRPLLEKVASDQVPLFIAIVERMAAQRYRVWADAIKDEAYARDLRACADREDEIADKVAALYPNAQELEAELRNAHPELDKLASSVFDDLSTLEEYAVQAEGERIGAATWRGFAETADAPHRDVFLACADLEEASAEVLEEIIEAGG